MWAGEVGLGASSVVKGSTHEGRKISLSLSLSLKN